MKITEQRNGRVTVIQPKGSVLGGDADQLAKQLTKALEDSAGAVVLDASQMVYLDSKALEALVDTTERLIRTGGALKLAAAGDVVREVLELTELASLFERYDTVDAAVGSFG